jgi:hypothetical protein
MKKMILILICSILTIVAPQANAEKATRYIYEAYISGGNGSWLPFDSGFGWVNIQNYTYDNQYERIVKQKTFCQGDGSLSCPVGKLAVINDYTAIPKELQENTLDDFHNIIVLKANAGTLDSTIVSNVIYDNIQYYRNYSWSVDSTNQLMMNVEIIKP